MSIWSRLFGHAAPVRPGPTATHISSNREIAARPLLSDGANKQLVHGSLVRLEAAGLRIGDALDRDLIVARFLLSFAVGNIVAVGNVVDDLTAFFADKENGGSKNSLDLTVFWALASETGVFCDFEEIGTVLPKLSEMPDEELSDMLDKHSKPIFENAAAIWIVNEDGPGEYVRRLVGEMTGLAGGDFDVQSVTESNQSSRVVGTVTLNNGDTGLFDVSYEKRPDLTTFFKMMNSLVAPLGKGRFVVVLTGGSDDLIAIYLRPSEVTDFRNWEERQYCAGGPTPVDWLE